MSFGRFVDLDDKSDVPTITSSKGTYALEDTIGSGDIAEICRSGDAVLKIPRSEKLNDLMENETSILRHLWKEGEPEDKHRRYLPNLIDTFKTDEKKPRHVNVFVHLKNFFSFEQIRKAHLATDLRFEHGVWMFNRILECLDYLHAKKVIHGGIIPPHVMVYSSENNKDPFTHGAKLIDFTGSVPTDGRISVVSSSWKTFYPPEVFEKKPATPATDIYMAVKSLIYVLGGNPETNLLPGDVPIYLIKFLRACVEAKPAQRPKDAWGLHEELEGLMLRNFGPKKYIHFDMPKTA